MQRTEMIPNISKHFLHYSNLLFASLSHLMPFWFVSRIQAWQHRISELAESLPPCFILKEHVTWAVQDCTLRRWDFKEGTLLQTFPVLSAEIRPAKHWALIDCPVLAHMTMYHGSYFPRKKCASHWQTESPWWRAAPLPRRCMSCVSTNSVITGDERGYIQVWDTDAGTVQRVLTAHKDCSDLQWKLKGRLCFCWLCHKHSQTGLL